MTKPTTTLPQQVGAILKHLFNTRVYINEVAPTPEPLIPGRLTRPTQAPNLRCSCTGNGTQVIIKIVVYSTDEERLDEVVETSVRDAKALLGQHGFETNEPKGGTAMDYPNADKHRAFKYVSHTFTAWP